jgi:hypothetical protein
MLMMTMAMTVLEFRDDDGIRGGREMMMIIHARHRRPQEMEIAGE